MSTDFRGDPSAALLEVLDPEQNHTFNDHYLDLDYDLSRGDVHHAPRTRCTASPVPLQDRMEIIQLAGYTEFEKLNIARAVPGAAQAEGGERPRGRRRSTLTENAIRTVIHHYTREAGVRSLEREIASVCRKVARDVVQERQGDSRSTSSRKSVPKYLGVPKYRLGKTEERGRDRPHQRPRRAPSYGGELLACEVTVVPGKGKLVITGMLEKGCRSPRRRR